MKTALIYNVSCFNSGAGASVGGLSPPKPSRSNGTGDNVCEFPVPQGAKHDQGYGGQSPSNFRWLRREPEIWVPIPQI